MLFYPVLSHLDVDVTYHTTKNTCQEQCFLSYILGMSHLHQFLCEFFLDKVVYGLLILGS